MGKSNLSRIAIIGVSGAGKSTLANKIGQKLGRKVDHLDMYYWTNKWKERYSKLGFLRVVTDLQDQEEWIIDGNYRKTIDDRFEKATMIIFLDFPKWLCLWRAFKRIFNTEQPFDKTDGTRERISWNLVKYILQYPTKTMYQKVLSHSHDKKVYILKDNEEIDEFLKSLCI